MAEIPLDQGMDEHAPRGGGASDQSNKDYEPTAEEQKAIKLVDKLFQKAKKYRSQFDEKWLDFYRMFRGRQWNKDRPSYRHAEVINLIFRSIQSQVPLQTDTRPKFEFQPTEPSDQELSKIMNQVGEADWISQNWSPELLEVIYDSNIYGTGISKMVVREVKGALKIVYESADPFYSFPDPDARDFNKGCEWFVYAEPEEVSKVRRRYPHLKEFIKPDLIDLMKNEKAEQAPMRFKTPAESKTVVDSTNHYDLMHKDQVLVQTLYMSAEACQEDFDEVEVNTVDPESGEAKTEYEQRAKYPNGRKIVVANGVLLEDGPNGYDDGEIPFQKYANYVMPREFWGMSEVEQLEGPQKTFNKLVSFALDVLTLMGNPIWKVHGASGCDPESLINRPGLVVEWDGPPETEPKREEGVALQPYVLQLIDRMGNWFDDVAGSQDVSRGLNPSGVTAASAIASLQEAAQTRIRQKQRNLDGYLQNVGQQYLSRVFQFKTAPEVYRLTGDDQTTKYFKMHVEEYPKTGEVQNPTTGEVGTGPTGEIGKRVVYQEYGPSGQINLDAMKTFEMQSKFDVKVSTGSNLPFAKAQRDERLRNDFKLGLIDQEEVLKNSDYTNWQAIMQRMQQAAMAQQQAEMAAQAPPANAPPPAA